MEHLRWQLVTKCNPKQSRKKAVNKAVWNREVLRERLSENSLWTIKIIK